MPIHRLDEQPTVSAILADLTCGQSLFNIATMHDAEDHFTLHVHVKLMMKSPSNC